MENDIINIDLIEMSSFANNKDDVLNEFANLAYINGRITDKSNFLEDVYLRENELSTSMGLGIAIPHAKSKYVLKSTLVFIKLKNAIKWDNIDKVNLVFGIAVPAKNESNIHLQILSKLARKLADEDFKKYLLCSQTKKDVLESFKICGL